MLASLRSARRVLVVLATASAVAACSEALSGPSHVRDDAAAANNSLLGGVLNGLHLLQCQPQSYDSVTQVINGSGGTINVGQHTFVVPPGALSGNVSITAVAPNANRREVRFQPEGLTFKKPATLTLSYSGCSLVSQLIPKKIVYMDDDLDLLELIGGIDNILSKTVTGKIEHFSGYAVWY